MHPLILCARMQVLALDTRHESRRPHRNLVRDWPAVRNRAVVEKLRSMQRGRSARATWRTTP